MSIGLNEIAEATEEIITLDIITEEDCESSSDGEESDSTVETNNGEDELETEPVFGYDSFEDREYYSYSEGELAEDFSDQEALKPYIDYRRELHASRGFKVDKIPDDLITGYFPIDLNDTRFGWKSPDGTARGYMERMVALALDKYNQTKGLDVKMEYVVRTVACKSSGIKCYITFMAKETPDGPLVEYQAKTEWKIRQVHTYPIFCRPSPPPADLKEKARTSTRFLPRRK